MKRSPWVTGATVVQILVGVLLAGLSLFLLSLTRSTAILQEKDAAETISGLRIAACMFGPPALLVLASAYGMWKGKLWAWWLALLMDVGVVGACVYSMLDDGWQNVDWELVIFATVPLIAAILLLVPAVRGFYWRSGNSPLPPATVEHSSL